MRMQMQIIFRVFMMIYSFIHNFTVQPQKYVDPHDVIVTYISNIDYFHPFMLCLYGAYLLFILAMIKFRRSTMMQVLGFVSCAFSLQSIDIINTYLHKTVGQTWYTENPFLEDVLFTKLTVGLPLICSFRVCVACVDGEESVTQRKLNK
jgi:hypothetical protein